MSGMHRVCSTLMALASVLFCAVDVAAADVQDRGAPPVAPSYWIAPGQGGVLPARARYHDSLGDVEVVFAQGPVTLQGNPFFEPLGMY